jgi:signal transduction histidine kinase
LRAASADYREALTTRERLQTELATLPDAPPGQQSANLGYQIHRVGSSSSADRVWVEVQLTEETEIDAVVLVPIDAPTRDFQGPGYGFPPRFRVDVMSETATHPIAIYDAEAMPNPGRLPVWLPAQGVRGRRVRITALEPWTQIAPYAVVALGEVMVMRGNRNLAAGATVISSEPRESLTVWGRPDFLTDSQSVLGAPLAREPSRTLGYHSELVDSADRLKWVQVDLGAPTRIDEVRMVGGYVVQFPSRPGFGFPQRFKIEAADEPDFLRPLLLVDHTAADFPNPSSNPITFSVRGATARYVRVTATKLWERVENYAFALAELQVYSGDRNVALGRPVICLDRYPSSGSHWQPENLTDGYASGRKLAEWPGWLRGLSRRRETLLELAAAEEHAARARDRAGQRLVKFGWFASLLGVVGLMILVQRYRLARERELARLRQSIASDLHDEIGSNLGTIALLSELGLTRAGGMARSDTEEIRRIARQTTESMRDIVGLILRPAVTADEFVAGLRAIASRMLEGLEWTFQVSPTISLPPLAAQRHLLLAFKEALHNLRKHSGARHVRIAIEQASGHLRFSITDDGVGFDPEKTNSGHGLNSLRQRAAALGGELTISSAPAAGTTLVFSASLHAIPSQ